MDERITHPNWKAYAARAQKALAKWRLPLLILALGALLLLWPSGEKTAESEPEPARPVQQTQQDQLHALLCAIDGVGRVQLMLTTSGSEETCYQTDVRMTGETREETTVFSSNQSAQKTPVVTRTKMAPYLGAVVVCDGADSAAVRLRVIQAVSALTGLGSDKISVIKMKRQ